jgi:hypothetical protein
VVLLLPPRLQVPSGPAHQPRHGDRLLEGPGKDREVRSGHSDALVDMKKTLIFYRGVRPQEPEDAQGHARIPPQRHLRLPFPPQLYEG